MEKIDRPIDLYSELFLRYFQRRPTPEEHELFKNTILLAVIAVFDGNGKLRPISNT